MNYFSKIFSFLTGNAMIQKTGKQLNSPAISAHDDTPNISVDGALQVSTVWACVTLLVETIGSLPLHVYRNNKDSRETAKDSRIYKILHDSPNKRQTAQEFWEQMMLNYVLRGNAYARVDRDASGEAIALWPLSSDQIEVVVAEDGSLVYLYSFEQKGIVYNESDILHIRGMGNGVVGMSPLDYMRSSVGLAINAQNHTAKTFKKDARRPGVLMSDSVLTPEQRTAVKNNFGDIVSGNGKELYVLEAQFKFEPLGMSPADIQLLESRKFAVQDIARWFGVPSILINDTAESTSLGSSTEQIIDGFHRLKLRPQLERIEQAISKRVLTAKQRSQGYEAEFNLDALLRASLKDRMEIYAKAVQNGLKTRNECRARENDAPIAGGDFLTAQTNLAPLDMLGNIQQTSGVPSAPVQQ
jgi:HK97 family phage portal protein